MQKNMKTSWTEAVLTCNLPTLHALGVFMLWASVAVCAFAQDGKTKIRAGSTAMESRNLDRHSEVEGELKVLKRQQLVLEERCARLEREAAQLRQKLFENIQRYQSQEDRSRRFQLSIAATLANTGRPSAGDREGELLDALRLLCDKNKTLTLSVSDFCDYLDAALSRMNIDKVEKARLAIHLDKLRKCSARLSTAAELIASDQNPGECRILEVDKELRLVILAAGSVHGVRNGLNWYADKSRNCRLQVVGVRPFIAAAVVVEGNIRELAPGMCVYTGSGKNKTERTEQWKFRQ